MVITLMLVIGSPAISVQAKKHHKSDDSSGFSRGAADAAKCNTDNCDTAYMNQHGKGWDNHSNEFNKNYAKGFCAAKGGEDNIIDRGVVDCGD